MSDPKPGLRGGEEPMPPQGETMGVSGAVQYDLDITCHADDHEENVDMVQVDELSDQNNPILECPDCGRRRACDVTVAPLGGGEGW